MSTPKERFLEKVLSLEENKESHFNVMPRDIYNKLLNEYEEAKASSRKTPRQYRRVKRFNVLEESGKKMLVTNNEPVKYYLPAEDTFEAIKEVHLDLGHAGRDKVRAVLSKKYANITREMVKVFISCCEPCQNKNLLKTKINEVLDSKYQFGIVDMQKQPDNELKFILVCLHVTTKFVVLRPLRTDEPKEIADHLCEIFSLLGAPCILQSGQGIEFVNSIIRELSLLWPELKMVCGNVSTQRENVLQNIKDETMKWMQANSNANWSHGLRFIQFTKNNAHNCYIKGTPFKATFKTDFQKGLNNSYLPSEAFTNVHNEDDLIKAIDQIRSTYTDSNPLTRDNEEDVQISAVSTIAKGPKEENSSENNAISTSCKTERSDEETPFKKMKLDDIKVEKVEVKEDQINLYCSNDLFAD